MHRVVIFSNSVYSNGEALYGRLYSGNSEREILISAKLDLKTLLVREKFEDEEGEEFRQNENWVPYSNEDGSGWWSYDKNKYSYLMGYDPIPDQFVQAYPPHSESVALLSGWVPLKMAHTNLNDYIINQAFYYSVIESNPNDICWCSVDETGNDELPF